MWNWLKNKPRQSDNELRVLAEQLIGPQALAISLAETVRAYVAAVQAGKISYPAHRRKGSSVVEIWADLRIEALHKMFNFGQSNPFLLSDLQRQEELLACFLDERPHFEMPQPRGAVIPDTIQAMFQVYLYLDAAGSEVADRETDRTGLKLVGRSILDRMESECGELRLRLPALRVGTSEGTIPPTMIELLYEDVTVKAKSIALSAKFGPHYEGGIKFVEDQLAKQDEDLAAFRASVTRVMAAKDPDHLSSDR
ncbi:hypothetical protein [Stappia sp. P2PMeth1]|uniref:hypothetical protein n=1 Tax=Stappia sp. P2PMeth1 TaxID=2003586 RepID=UPI001645645D|nr:hypothetical protein [Stappia sp. P2PMeth1]